MTYRYVIDHWPILICHYKKASKVSGLLLFLILLVFLLNRETTSDAVYLVSCLERSDLCDLCRRRRLGIAVCYGTSESSRRAFRCVVIDSLFIYPLYHPF